MATINTVTFNQGSTGVAGTYAPGDTVTATVNYVSDTPSVVPQTFTLTTSIADAAGTVTATNSTEFVVNTTNPAGDAVQISDSGGHTWTAGTLVVETDGSLSQPHSATA